MAKGTVYNQADNGYTDEKTKQRVNGTPNTASTIPITTNDYTAAVPMDGRGYQLGDVLLVKNNSITVEDPDTHEKYHPNAVYIVTDVGGLPYGDVDFAEGKGSESIGLRSTHDASGGVSGVEGGNNLTIKKLGSVGDLAGGKNKEKGIAAIALAKQINEGKTGPDGKPVTLNALSAVLNEKSVTDGELAQNPRSLAGTLPENYEENIEQSATSPYRRKAGQVASADRQENRKQFLHNYADNLPPEQQLGFLLMMLFCELFGGKDLLANLDQLSTNEALPQEQRTGIKGAADEIRKGTDHYAYKPQGSDYQAYLNTLPTPKPGSESVAKIVLDAGHGFYNEDGRTKHDDGTDGADHGASGVTEDVVTQAIAKRTAEILKTKGFTNVELTRPDRNTVLSSRFDARREVADKIGADTFVSIHMDERSAGDNGGTAWVTPHSTQGSKDLAACFAKNFGDKSQGGIQSKSERLGLIYPEKQKGRDAVLVEVDNLNNSQIQNRALDPAQINRRAQELASAIEEHEQRMGRSKNAIELAQAQAKKVMQDAGDEKKTAGLDLSKVDGYPPKNVPKSDTSKSNIPGMVLAYAK